MTSSLKAGVVTAFFTILGGWYARGFFETPTLLGGVILFIYVLLLIHTFYSIRCFSRISIPSLHGMVQVFLDILLLLIYAAVTINLSSPLGFSVFSTILFALAIPKYAHLRGVISHPGFKALLSRKMRAEAIGMGVSLGIAVGTFQGYALPAFILGAALYARFTFYYFYERPLYPIHNKD